jgi:hypothetical protein
MGKPGRFVAPSAPGALGHDRQSLFEIAPGLFHISPSDAGHCHGSGDDHISQFGEEVIAAAADPLREFRPCMPMNASAASPVSSVSLSSYISTGTSRWQAYTALI